MTKLVQLQDKRSQTAKAMRTLTDQVSAETGMTAEQETQWEAMNKDINALDKAIQAEEAVARLEARLDTFDPAQRPDVKPSAKARPHGTEEYEQAFEAFVRSPSISAEAQTMLRKVQAALNTGTDTEGGFVVPESWTSQLIKDLADQNIMRQLATVRSYTSTTSLPIVDDKGAAGWVDELAAYPESDVAFANKKLEAWKLGRIMKVSEEILEDSLVNLVSEIGMIFAETFGLAEETACFAGNGTSKPRGVLIDAEVGVTAAVNNAITLDEIMDLEYSVKEVFRRNATWTVRDGTAKIIRKMKDAEGRPLWQPSLVAGQPDTFSGKPLRTTDGMPALAANASPIAFGDFSYYVIADRGGIFMQRLNEKYADEGAVGFKMRKRVDGKLTRNHAVKRLLMPA